MKLFDGHCDTLLTLHFAKAPVGALEDNKFHVSLRSAEELDAYAQFFAIFGVPDMVPGGDIFDILYGRFLGELEKNEAHMAFCRTRADADAAAKAHKAAAFLSVEGAEVLGCDLKRLEDAYEKGVRSLCLTWNRATPLCGTNVEEPERGLSAAGKDYVRAAQALGLLLDVSHLSDAGFWDLEKLMQGPFIASHSNSRAVWQHSRNLTDDMFRAIRDHGGTAGLNLYAAFLGEEGSVTVETCVRHMEHFLDLGGEKTLAIGGDLDGCEALPEGMRGLRDMHLLWDALKARGYDDALLEDIFYNNLYRALPM